MNVIDRLDEEWSGLVRSPRFTEALARWSREDPTLCFRSLVDLQAEVERRDQPPGAADRILAALARRAPTDTVAARVLLQLLLPGCKALVTRYRFECRDDRAAFVASTAWDRIRTYPFDRRPAKIAANVLLDVRQRLLRLHGPVGPAPIDEVPDELLPVETGEPEVGLEVVQTLGWAVREGHLDAESAHLIALTRVAGFEVEELARQRGVKAQTLRQQRLRAESRLRAAVVVV